MHSTRQPMITLCK